MNLTASSYIFWSQNSSPHLSYVYANIHENWQALQLTVKVKKLPVWGMNELTIPKKKGNFKIAFLMFCKEREQVFIIMTGMWLKLTV